jgi:exosome complex exonuclease DIS3/RRP44
MVHLLQRVDFLVALPGQALAASLDAAVRPGDAYFNKLVRILATRCMTQAAYFGSGDASPPEYGHYGLAAPLYTHFTSPIRRCAPISWRNEFHAHSGVAPVLLDALQLPHRAVRAPFLAEGLLCMFWCHY